MMFLIRLLKRLIILAILFAVMFCGAYYFSGGTIFFEPATALRINRIIFLEREVNNSLDRDNYVSIDEMPESLTQAVVAVEDNRFSTPHGFDPEGIGRAALVNLQYGEVKEGASTITQQLVKNMFLSQDQTYGRKAEELLLALDMELHYSKEQILEMYLNTIYFGSGFYGLKDACKGYFDKTPDQLALPEAAMLAGIPNAPSVYSPYENFKLAKQRQFIVLDAMVRAGYLRENIAEDAKIKPLYLAHQ
ncbi:MAG: transglycosylase domain-containing protein [Anaerovibrio sp.]|nr:transglycosylase domain-containing protein [Anaerovibrio sp.]